MSDSPVNVCRAQCVASSFSIVYGAGRACLMPFLGFYMLYLGMNARQTGLILGIKAFTSVCAGALWSRCAKHPPSRRRYVLMFALVILILSHLVMTLMPSMHPEKAEEFCLHSGTANGSHEHGTLNTSANLSATVGLTTFLALSSAVTSAATLTPVSPTIRTASITLRATTTTTTSLDSDDGDEMVDEGSVHLTPDQEQLLRSLNLTVAEAALLAEKDPNALKQLYKDKFGKKQVTKHSHSVHRREDALTSTREMKTAGHASTNIKANTASNDTLLTKLQIQLKLIEQQAFAAMLIVVLIGEMFSSPAERFPSVMWRDFTVSADLQERTNVPDKWVLVGAVLTPWAITLAVDHVACHLPPFGAHRIMLHFYSFAAVMGIAFLLAFCYPAMPTALRDVPLKPTTRSGGTWKSLRKVFGTFHSALNAVNVLVLGIVYGVIGTFLLWEMHKNSADGAELPLGLAVTAAAVGELFVTLCMPAAMRRLGAGVIVTVGLGVLAGRCVLYSFLFVPWMALPGEALHAFSHTMLWGAARAYPVFHSATAPGMTLASVPDHGVMTVLLAIYQGIGVSLGCIAGGLVYEWQGSSVMFQAAAVLAAAWCLLYVLLYHCVARRGGSKEKARYARLLQEDDERHTVASDDEDDWLNTAIKHQK